VSFLNGCGTQQTVREDLLTTWLPKLACYRNTAASGKASLEEAALFRDVARPTEAERVAIKVC